MNFRFKCIVISINQLLVTDIKMVENIIEFRTYTKIHKKLSHSKM